MVSFVPLMATLVLAALLLATYWVRAGGSVHAYVVSMPDGSRPRGEVSRRLAASGICAQFVDAVAGTRGVSASELSRFRKPYPWLPRQIGCALSHMRLWRSMRGPALIMEDDARPVPDFARSFRRILKELDDTVDVVFLGHCLEGRGAPWKGSAVLRASVLPRCTHAYYVTAGGLPKLARWASTASLSLPIDEELALLCKSGALTCVSAFPQLALQEWQDE